MRYSPIRLSDIPKPKKRFPRIDWPLLSLEPGEGFIVRTVDGFDSDGRSERYIRTLARIQAERRGILITCRKVPGGIAILRRHSLDPEQLPTLRL